MLICVSIFAYKGDLRGALALSEASQRLLLQRRAQWAESLGEMFKYICGKIIWKNKIPVKNMPTGKK